jgi:hypothetical protein
MAEKIPRSWEIETDIETLRGIFVWERKAETRGFRTW